ncbi:conserved hypothetical protein [Vibrio jasicida]|uniref:Transposase n=1 Tax=Vibrio jasicida TaxID=766224 RepID=A0AAU9QPW9_9VIBR|nr:conserved hypothetical protein [Vibrio jasicida]
MTLSQELYDQLNQLDLKKARRSKVDQFQREIIFLRQNKLTYSKIKSWLKKEKNLDISISQLAHCVNVRWKNEAY